MAKAAPKKSTEELYAWDAEKRGSGLLLCGVDEAGRGPLAGDVYAAAVILDPSKPLIAGLDDSKKMTEKKRESLFAEVQSACLAYCVASATVAEIEKLNILGPPCWQCSGQWLDFRYSRSWYWWTAIVCRSWQCRRKP